MAWTIEEDELTVDTGLNQTKNPWSPDSSPTHSPASLSTAPPRRRSSEQRRQRTAQKPR